MPLGVDEDEFRIARLCAIPPAPRVREMRASIPAVGVGEPALGARGPSCPWAGLGRDPHTLPGEGSSSVPRPPGWKRGGRDAAACWGCRQGAESSALLLQTNAFVSSHCGIGAGSSCDVVMSTAPRCQLGAKRLRLGPQAGSLMFACAGHLAFVLPREEIAYGHGADRDALVTCALPSAAGAVKTCRIPTATILNELVASTTFLLAPAQ